MKKGLLFSLVKWSRAIRILLGGYTKRRKLAGLPIKIRSGTVVPLDII